MLLRNVTILLLIVGRVAVYACLGPENVFGIRFNNEESIDISVIENLGKEDINYYKVEEDGLLKYSFRSHYNPSIMIEMSIVSGSGDLSGLLTFTVDTSVVPIAGFPFGACVRPELDWLVEVGVVSMDRVVREGIEQDFVDYKDPFNTGKYETNSGFFWTRQDSLLPNNMFFGSDGSIIATAVRCEEIQFAVTDLPPQPLNGIVAVVTKDTKAFSRGHIAADPVRPSMLLVDIRGRMHGTDAAGWKSNRSGVLLSFDRRSGKVKRAVTLP